MSVAAEGHTDMTQGHVAAEVRNPACRARHTRHSLWSRLVPFKQCQDGTVIEQCWLARTQSSLTCHSEYLTMLLALLLLAGLCAAQPDNLHKDFNQLYPYSPFFYPFNPYFYPFYTPYYSHPNLLHQAKDDFKDIKPGYKVPEGKEGHVLPPFVYAPFPLEKTFYQAAPQSKQDFQPEFKAPEFKLPEFKAPEYKVPEYKAPEVPEFQVPEYKVPDFQAPKFKEVPDFEPPQFKEVPYHEDPQEVHIAPPAEPKDTQIVHKEEPAYQTFMFIGKYEGKCSCSTLYNFL